jgi:hypothetical protein
MAKHMTLAVLSSSSAAGCSPRWLMVIICQRSLRACTGWSCKVKIVPGISLILLVSAAPCWVGKNDLNQNEVSELNRVVNMWLDFAEDQARRRQQVFLRDWQDKLDQFLQFNDREVLQDASTVSKKTTDEEAQAEYVQFAEQQRR